MPRSLVEISRRLARAVDELELPVPYVYNPLVYAREPHERWLERWGGGDKRVLLLGMNPGPFGMGQTGVPFGEVALVRDWLGVEGKVGRPPNEHPKKPVLGFGCKRSEVSGARLWGFVRRRWQEPERFFAEHFVANWCPLLLLGEGGANLTPDKLPVAARRALEVACDRALAETVDATGATTVIGVGQFAAVQAARVLAGRPVRIASILHPSPANPRANREWETVAAAELEACGVQLPPLPAGPTTRV